MKITIKIQERVQGSGRPIARELAKPEYCCEIVGSNNFPRRYIAHGMHPCRINARWEIAGKFYCTHHAKKRLATFQNADFRQPETKD